MNIRPLLLPLLASAALVLSASAEPRTLVLPAGRSEVVELGFTPKGRRIVGKELVTVSLREGSTSAVIVAGETQGACQVEFLDAGGGDGLMIQVEVVGDLDDTLRSLRKWLADFDGLEFVKGKSTVTVTGTISNPSDWAKFEKVCALSDFKGKIEKVVEFSVDPATINALRKELETAGVPLVPAGQPPADGRVSMEYEHNVLRFTGTVWSKADIDTILRVLKGHSWLDVVDAPKDAATSTVAQAVVNVSVDDSLFELGVAFVMVSKNAGHNLETIYRDKDGNTAAGIVVRGLWNGFYDFLTGRHSHNGADTFRVDASLDATLTMFAENGVSRERQYGTIRFRASGAPGQTLHIGGSMKVTPPASGEGEAPDAQDYDYGFKIINKGSHRLDAETAEADIEIELDGEPVFEGSASGAISVRQTKKNIPSQVAVRLGETVAVAGYESLLENTTLPSGTPYLRHIPILNWFVAKQGEELKDSTMLFLVSIREVKVEDEAPMIPNSPMKDITLDANTPNKKRANDERARDVASRAGCSPLGWLSRLFQ